MQQVPEPVNRTGTRKEAAPGSPPGQHLATPCTLYYLIIYSWRVGSASTVSSSGHPFQPSSSSSDTPITFRKDLPKLGDKSLYINTFKTVCVRDTDRQKDGGGREEGKKGGRQRGTGDRRQANDSFFYQRI